MVLDTLANAPQYESLNPHFAKAFAFLRRADLASLAAGRHEVDGANVYALVTHEPGRGHDGAKREAHRNYIDIQFCLVGTDEIGYRPLSDCHAVKVDYSPDKDVILYADEPTTWLAVPPGSFTILFPADCHAPLGATGPLHKVVVKVAVA